MTNCPIHPETAKRINWRVRRLGFRCYCAACKGKFWQAKYGERSTDFRNRYNSAHKRHQP